MTDSNGAYASSNHHKYTRGGPIYQWHLQRFMQRMGEMLMEPEPQRVLDAGCGEGFATQYLAQQHPDLHLTGVDLSEEAVAYANEHFGAYAQFRQGSVYKLPFSENAFDVVLCSEVLEHLDEPERAVAELKRVARSHVLITVPREPYFKWLNDLGRLMRISPDPGHVNFWTKETFPAFVGKHFDQVEYDWVHIYQLALAEV